MGRLGSNVCAHFDHRVLVSTHEPVEMWMSVAQAPLVVILLVLEVILLITSARRGGSQHTEWWLTRGEERGRGYDWQIA